MHDEHDRLFPLRGGLRRPFVQMHELISSNIDYSGLTCARNSACFHSAMRKRIIAHDRASSRAVIETRHRAFLIPAKTSKASRPSPSPRLARGLIRKSRNDRSRLRFLPPRPPSKFSHRRARARALAGGKVSWKSYQRQSAADKTFTGSGIEAATSSPQTLNQTRNIAGGFDAAASMRFSAGCDRSIAASSASSSREKTPRERQRGRVNATENKLPISLAYYSRSARD